MRRSLVPGLLILLVVVLTACSSGSDDDLPSPTTVPDATAVASPTSSTSETTPSPSPTSTLTPTFSPTSPASIPVAVIEEISPNPVYANQEVVFRGSGSDPKIGIGAYRWSIEGYGAIARKATFSSTVVTKKAGTYTVEFEVQNNFGVWSPKARQVLTVLAVPPSAKFSAETLFGDVPLSVKFTDLSTREITNRTWDFGDGETSTEQSPMHTYTSAGTYTVRLAVQGPDGSDIETREAFIETVDIDFTADVTGGNLPLAVRFIDQSSGDIVGWSWSFGQGEFSAAQNPTYTFTIAGDYDVTLTVVTSSGQKASETKAQYLKVLPPAPVADFYSPATIHANALYQFIDYSTGIITSWSWYFGDGHTSSVQHPFHIYNRPGAYTVTLVVNGPGGYDSHQQSILVEP